ncbi:MAG: hypothetical protein K6T85_19055 [Gorillibacterium sp.]|nr:hypothetical protein [Gorillibacterium sp.]
MLVIALGWNWGSHYWFDRLEIWNVPMKINAASQWYREVRRKDRLLPIGHRRRGDVIAEE